MLSTTFFGFFKPSTHHVAGKCILSLFAQKCKRLSLTF